MDEHFRSTAEQGAHSGGRPGEGGRRRAAAKHHGEVWSSGIMTENLENVKVRLGSVFCNPALLIHGWVRMSRVGGQGLLGMPSRRPEKGLRPGW